MGAQQGDTGVLSGHRGLEGGEGSPYIKDFTRIALPSLCQTLKLGSQTRALRRAGEMREVYHEQEVQALLGIQHVVDAAHHVAAAGEHQGFDLGLQGKGDEGLAKAAEVGMGEPIGIFKGSGLVGNRFAGSAVAGQKLDGRVFAGIVNGGSHPTLLWIGGF